MEDLISSGIQNLVNEIWVFDYHYSWSYFYKHRNKTDLLISQCFARAPITIEVLDRKTIAVNHSITIISFPVYRILDAACLWVCRYKDQYALMGSVTYKFGYVDGRERLKIPIGLKIPVLAAPPTSSPIKPRRRLRF